MSEFLVLWAGTTIGIPVLFLQGSPGYMVGKAEEWGGIGKYGADSMRALQFGALIILALYFVGRLYS